MRSYKTKSYPDIGISMKNIDEVKHHQQGAFLVDTDMAFVAISLSSILRPK